MCKKGCLKWDNRDIIFTNIILQSKNCLGLSLSPTVHNYKEQLQERSPSLWETAWSIDPWSFTGLLKCELQQVIKVSLLQEWIYIFPSLYSLCSLTPQLERKCKHRSLAVDKSFLKPIPNTAQCQQCQQAYNHSWKTPSKCTYLRILVPLQIRHMLEYNCQHCLSVVCSSWLLYTNQTFQYFQRQILQRDAFIIVHFSRILGLSPEVKEMV